MRRLLKVKEFCHLKKRDAETSFDSNNSRSTKRPRVAAKCHKTSSSSSCSEQDSIVHVLARAEGNSIARGGQYERFIKLFENERTRDIVWWLPGRKGEAFAMKKELFEHELLKSHFQLATFAEFEKQLTLWGFRHMSIASLSGTILAFESNARGALDQGSPLVFPAPRPQESNRLLEVIGNLDLSTFNSLALSNQEQLELQARALQNLQTQQNQYFLQQEIAQTYFSLLWQDLQIQLTSAMEQQDSLSPTAATPEDEQRRSDANTIRNNYSTIVNVANWLYQHQAQQQLIAAALCQSSLANPSRMRNESLVVQELNELHQQQLNNLTYQIVALVAANVEQQNSQAQISESTLLQTVLVKYLIALVLVQLQQQQQNLEFLHQDRLTALSVIRSVPSNNESSSSTDIPVINEEIIQPIASLHMQQLLSEAAMLSLTRAHNLLSEAAMLTPILSPRPGHANVSLLQQPTNRTPVTFPRVQLTDTDHGRVFTQASLLATSARTPRAATA